MLPLSIAAIRRPWRCIPHVDVGVGYFDQPVGTLSALLFDSQVCHANSLWHLTHMHTAAITVDTRTREYTHICNSHKHSHARTAHQHEHASVPLYWTHLLQVVGGGVDVELVQNVLLLANSRIEPQVFIRLLPVPL